MLLESCPMCGNKDLVDVPQLGRQCTNCDEIFRSDERYGISVVTLEEYKEFLEKAKKAKKLIR